MRLDFAADVVGLASQPFWLSWGDGRRGRRHAPDYVARLADGTGLVIDCRPVGRIKPADAAAFAATERACAEVGWRYELAHEQDPVLMANLRWLAGYRHARCRRGSCSRGRDRPAPAAGAGEVAR
ncbi:TnsA-like heteromeric transposase endonuclease subunit [Lentzea flava]|uniref:TnsA-like heteromeric transposase endonuclease subunit n=1 Tax=Lentzea flava TaxID=103732 RepID=UPI0034D768C7